VHCWVVAKDGKKVREKIRKIASKVEEEDFTEDLDMVTVLHCPFSWLT